MTPLECMSKHYDGSRWGLSDWYPAIEAAIQESLNRGPQHCWTTGWYSSRKEPVSACITCTGNELQIEVSVTDDFDTPGLGTQILPHTTDLNALREAVDAAWTQAQEDRCINRV